MRRLAAVGALLVLLGLPADARPAAGYDLAVSVTGPATFRPSGVRVVPFTVRVVNLGPGPSTPNVSVLLSGGTSRERSGSQGVVYLSQLTGYHCIAAVTTGCLVPQLAPNESYRVTLVAEWRAVDVQQYARRRPLYLVVSAQVNMIGCGAQETSCDNNAAAAYVRAR